MRKTPPQEHIDGRRETFALIAEALTIRDRDATKQALCQQIRACLHWQESIRRWLALSRTPNMRWHGITCNEAEELLKALESERKDLSAALVDLLASRPRKLTDDEEALLDAYENHEYGEPPAPGEPDLAEPGTPEKVKLLSDRLDARCGLWHDDDPRMEPTDRAAYIPRHAGGNFALIGRTFVLALLMTAPEEQL